MVKKICIWIYFGLLPLVGIGQNLIAYTTVNTNSAYIGQPVVLKVSVFTTTWFTKGVNIGNIQVDGALTVYFRSVSNSKTIKGKKYAGVDFYYNLFPTEEGILHIPPLEIQVETPKEGDYKGIKRVVRTKSKSIKVKGVPLGYDPNNWLVASSLSISQKWSVSLYDIKVGDVIQRTISRFAGGTLAEFIPETKFDSVYGTSSYPKRPQVKTNKSKTGVSSQRVETVNYLFEKEGEITLPVINYVYWNSSNKKFYIKKIDSVLILVKPNADLNMLTSIKKSLHKENIEDLKAENKEFLIFGVTPKILIKYLLVTSLLIFILIGIIKYFLLIFKRKHLSYMKSELYAFKQMQKALLKGDYNAYYKHSNTWINRLNINVSLSDFIREYGSPEMINIIAQNNRAMFKNNKKNDSVNNIVLVKEFKKSRNKFFEMEKNRKKSKNDEWLNPI